MKQADYFIKLARADDPEDTTLEEKEQIDREVVQDLLNQHGEVPPIHPKAVQTHTQIIETVRWTLAMDSLYDLETRRIAAQKKVADSEGPKLSTVQEKVRSVFDGRYGQRNAQEYFDEILQDIEEEYHSRMDAR